jgi:hypothetical protein
MNAGISDDKPAQAIREGADYTGRAAEQRNRGSAGQTVAFPMVPLLFALLLDESTSAFRACSSRAALQ